MLLAQSQELNLIPSEADAWLAVRGKVYDVTKWLKSHPGGKDVLLYNAVRDIFYTSLQELTHSLNY